MLDPAKDQIPLLWIMAGMFVMGVQLFRQRWLTNRFSLGILIILSIILFFAAIALEGADVRLHYPTRALYTPLFSVILFAALRYVFLRKLRREPVDTCFNWDPDLFWDRLLGFVFWIGSALFLLVLVAPKK